MTALDQWGETVKNTEQIDDTGELPNKPTSIGAFKGCI